MNKLFTIKTDWLGGLFKKKDIKKSSPFLTLGDVIALLVAFVFGFICFLSINFKTLGNVKQSILGAFVITVVLASMAIGLKKLKAAKTNLRTCRILEKILLIMLPLALCFFSYFFFTHFFTVFDRREMIKQKLVSNISQSEDMWKRYEIDYVENTRKLQYKRKLENAVQGKNINRYDYNCLGLKDTNVSDNAQIEKKMARFSEELLNKSKTNSAIGWLTEAKRTVVKWYPISIVSIVNDLEDNSNMWLEDLIKTSKYRERCEFEHTEDFQYLLSFKDVKSEFTQLGKPTFISSLLTLLAAILMLLSWRITKRSQKDHGAKDLKPYEVVLKLD